VEVVRQLPHGKALGLDGFAEFFRSCWDPVKAKVHGDVCEALPVHRVRFLGLSLISLILWPKS
jgi:hypothetical protein